MKVASSWWITQFYKPNAWLPKYLDEIFIKVLIHDIIDDSPQEILPPINLIIAEIEPILSHHPRTHPMNPTAISVPGSLKRLEALPRVVPFHRALHAVAAPEIRPHHPAEIIVFLQSTPSKIHLLRSTPNHQRHRGIVTETIDHSNIVFICRKQQPCPLYCGHHHDKRRG